MAAINASAFWWQTAIAHCAVVLWQVYSAVSALRAGQIVGNFLRGMGAEASIGVTLFLMTHRWWLVVPLIFSALAVMSLRRVDTRPMFSVFVLALGVIVALALNIWWREALFGSLFSLIEQVG